MINIARNHFLVWLNPMEAEPGCWGRAVRNLERSAGKQTEDPSFTGMNGNLNRLADFVVSNSTLTL